MEARLAGGFGLGFRLRRGLAEELRGIGELGRGALVAEQAPDRLAPRLAERIPERDLDAGEGMRRLQQIHAVELHRGADARDIRRIVQRLAQHRFAHRPAGAVGHGADIAGDAGERRGLAFAPAYMLAGLDPDQQGVLAAVGIGGDLGHGQIEEIDGIDLHAGSSRNMTGTPKAADGRPRSNYIIFRGRASSPRDDRWGPRKRLALQPRRAEARGGRLDGAFPALRLLPSALLLDAVAELDSPHQLVAAGRPCK